MTNRSRMIQMLLAQGDRTTNGTSYTCGRLGLRLILPNDTLVCISCILWPDLNLSPAALRAQQTVIATNLAPILGVIGEFLNEHTIDLTKADLARLTYWKIRDDL